MTRVGKKKFPDFSLTAKTKSSHCRDIYPCGDFLQYIPNHIEITLLINRCFNTISGLEIWNMCVGTREHFQHHENFWYLVPNIIQNMKTNKVRKTRQIWGIWKLRPAYSPETPNLAQNQWCFVPCDLEIWWMTLENNRAPLLCCFKLYASFHSHRWIQAGVTVQKRVKIDDFFSRVTLQFDIWPWKTIGHLFYATSSFVHHFVAIGEFKLELQSENAQSGSNSTIFRAVWPWNLTDDLKKQ